MTTGKIRELLREHPFRPFIINLNDGRSLMVDHVDFIAVPPEQTGTTVTVYAAGDLLHLVTVRNITSITRLPGPAQPPAAESGNGNGSPSPGENRPPGGSAA
jgi:hypothetical protein